MDVLILLQGMPPVAGHPVTGNGLRAHGLASGLEARGHRVRLLTRSVDVPPDAGPAVPREILRYDDASTIPELVAASGAEAVVVCHWDLLECLPDPCPIPVVADLYGPRLVEAQFEQASLDREGARFVDQLRRADAFLVASQRQRWFALPWLMLAGFDCKTLPVHVVPISANPRAPVRFQRKPVADPLIVTGGVFWPWRESERPLERLLATLDREGRGHVQLYGGTYPLATEAPVPYRDPRERVGPHARLTFQGLVPYEQLFERYARAQLAFDVMEPNAERELSFSFRVIDYLAASLPVITNRFAEIADAIEGAEAGWCVDVARPDELEETLTGILRDPAEVARRGQNARRLVDEHYNWDRTIEPLDRYLRAPARAVRGGSVLGTLVQVAGEAFRAREDRLREIERSRHAVRRAEELDAELASLHRLEADRTTEVNLLRAELEARTRDLASIKDQAASRGRDELAHAAQLESDRDRLGREAEALRTDRDLLRARVEDLAASLRRATDEARDLRAAQDQGVDELRGVRALVEHRAAERDRALDAVRARDEALSRADDERKRLAAELARGEARIHELERRAEELREALAQRDAEVVRIKGTAGEIERERDRLADAAQSASRERDQLAAALERLETRTADADRRLEHAREQLVQRDGDAAHLRSTLAEAERDRDHLAEAAQLANARAEEERRQLASALERGEAKLAETDRRLEHAREQLAARELEASRAKGATLEAERERDRLAQDLQAVGRVRDALETRAHQLEQRLDARGGEVEDLARQVAALRGDIET
ncbi:MAG: glycosyltransferase [Deltaproteobacteria bacterium]|nr:glycosyltransferase [Deltaproteobacteria bacterium]